MIFFFFKQKTAYEMRISDWSSDVCSSDLQTPLLLISADDGRSYSKPLLSTGFAANKNAESLGMATAGAMAEQLNAEIRIHTRVTRLDPANRRVWIGNEPVSYRDLVLAWGAQTIPVPVRPEGRRGGKRGSVRVDVGGGRLIK